jgi:hypothetical protein
MTAVVTPSLRGRVGERVPGELRVVVGVAVDDARHQRETLRIDLDARRTDRVADRSDALAIDGQVTPHTGRTAAVVQYRIADHQIVHRRVSLSLLSWRTGIESCPGHATRRRASWRRTSHIAHRASWRRRRASICGHHRMTTPARPPGNTSTDPSP